MGRIKANKHGEKPKVRQPPAPAATPGKRKRAEQEQRDPFELRDDGVDARMDADNQDGPAGPRLCMDHDGQRSTSGLSDAEEQDGHEALHTIISDSDADDADDADQYYSGLAGPGPSSAAAAAAKAAGKRPSGSKGAQGKGAKQKGAKGKVPQEQGAQGVAGLLPADLDEGALRAAWAALPVKHRMAKEALLQRHRQQFPMWRFQLSQRFSLLFHGFGSKRQLLEAFASEALTDGGVLVLNGHVASVNAKAVLGAVAGMLTNRSFRGSSHLEMLGAIHAEPPGRRLYVLLHNIDGPGLRAPEEQVWLSRMALCPAVHLLASVDHANAALLWDKRVAAAFKWLWHEVASYAHYDVETADMAPILTSCLHSAIKRGSGHVLYSLVDSARAVFRVLAEWQLDDPDAEGCPMELLYRMCRERYLITAEHQLHAHLAEFRDHELVKYREASDGGRVMYVPMQEGVLRKVLQDMAAAEAT